MYVTENRIFLENYLGITNKLGLNSFFSYLRLVNTEYACEILDIFAKSKGLYFGTRSRGALTPWYQICLYTKSNYLPVVYRNAFRFPPKRPPQTIQALIFRFLKILFCVDYLGVQHYFGYSRKATINTSSMNIGLAELKRGSPYPEGLGVFVDLDDLLVIFYHIEYLISMITGIFDNLANETASLYNISSIQPNRISLSKSSGSDFLKEVNNKNAVLKKHIDINRPFINLIYEFRDKVIHREGFERIISPMAPHWSNLIIINHQIKDYIKQCGDKPSPYKIITEWGVIDRDGRIDLDPFYFAKNVVNKLIRFADIYLQLLGYDTFSNNIDPRDAFIKDLEYFKRTMIRA